eukprot:SAG31_NODE_35047_length_326_cov_2.052863_1_plen_83_part_10
MQTPSRLGARAARTRGRPRSRMAYAYTVDRIPVPRAARRYRTYDTRNILNLISTRVRRGAVRCLMLDIDGYGARRAYLNLVSY